MTNRARCFHVDQTWEIVRSRKGIRSSWIRPWPRIVACANCHALLSFPRCAQRALDAGQWAGSVRKIGHVAKDGDEIFHPTIGSVKMC